MLIIHKYILHVRDTKVGGLPRAISIICTCTQVCIVAISTCSVHYQNK